MCVLFSAFTSSRLYVVCRILWVKGWVVNWIGLDLEGGKEFFGPLLLAAV